jgi:hypothetical protein
MMVVGEGQGEIRAEVVVKRRRKQGKEGNLLCGGFFVSFLVFMQTCGRI